jgi:hypothetical protein
MYLLVSPLIPYVALSIRRARLYYASVTRVPPKRKWISSKENLK